MQFTLNLAQRESVFNLLTSGPGSSLEMAFGFRFGLTAKVKNMRAKMRAVENTPVTRQFYFASFYCTHIFDLLQIGQTVMKYACSRACQRPDLEPEKSGLVGLC